MHTLICYINACPVETLIIFYDHCEVNPMIPSQVETRYNRDHNTTTKKTTASNEKCLFQLLKNQFQFDRFFYQL